MPLQMQNDPMQAASPGADQESQLFEQQFSQMAQGMILNKYPELAQSVVTFKIIDSDIETGSAVGAFILERPTGLVYIPAVLCDNQLKPMEMMYVKDTDVFLPLSPEWIDEVERHNVTPLGNGVRVPQSLTSDVDIRNLVVPPITGRYSYASAKDLQLPEFLAKADNKTRAKCANILKNDVGLFKVAVAIYGSKTIIESLRPREEKTAEEVKKEPGLVFATKETPKKDFGNLFGTEAPAAMRGVAVKGYYAKDARKNLKRPVNSESKITLEEIRDSGAFKLFKSDGTEVKAFVFVRPHSFRGQLKYDKYTGPAEAPEFKVKRVPRGHGDHSYHEYTPDIKYIVVLENGDFSLLTKPPMGMHIEPGELSGTAAKAFGGEKSGPRKGKGIFVRNRGNHHPEATDVVTVNSVTSNTDGVTRVKASVDFSDFDIAIDKKASSIMSPKGANVAVVPADYSFVGLGERLWEDSFVSDPAELTTLFLDKLRDAGALSLSVKKAGWEDYAIPRTKFSGTKIATIYALASCADVSVEDAEQIVKTADEHGYCNFLLATPRQLVKLAEGEEKKKKSPTKTTTTVKEPVADPGAGGAPGGDPGMDPSMQGQDPNAAMGGVDPATGMPMDPAGAAMAAMPPSPTDQAVQELQEEVQRAHEEQMKLLQHKLDALQMVAQRTQEIVQGVGRTESPAIQQAVTVAGGAPAPGGAQPAAPAEPEAPVDTGLMHEASQLADPSMFDAAAVGTLAEHSSLKDLVSSYIPALQKSLDNTGRILLTMWIKGTELRQEMGEENFTMLEDRLRNVFRNMGDLVLRLSQNTTMMQEGTDPLDHEISA